MSPAAFFIGTVAVFVIAWIASVLDNRRIRRRIERAGSPFTADHSRRERVGVPLAGPSPSPSAARRDLSGRSGR